jgi:hypothetical protein
MDLEQAAEWLDQLGTEGRAQLAKIDSLDRDEIEQLHYYAPRMASLLDLVSEARLVKDDPRRGDIALAIIANDLAELADPKLLRHMHALFSCLAARDFTLAPVDRG